MWIPKGLKISRVFSKGSDGSKNLRCEILHIANYEYVNISSVAVLDIKLWLKEDSSLDTYHPSYSFNLFNQRLKIDTKYYHLLVITLYPT